MSNKRCDCWRGPRNSKCLWIRARCLGARRLHPLCCPSHTKSCCWSVCLVPCVCVCVCRVSCVWCLLSCFLSRLVSRLVSVCRVYVCLVCVSCVCVSCVCVSCVLCVCVLCVCVVSRVLHVCVVCLVSRLVPRVSCCLLLSPAVSSRRVLSLAFLCLLSPVLRACVCVCVCVCRLSCLASSVSCYLVTRKDKKRHHMIT